MELLVLQIVAFLRPIFFIKYGGEDLFDLAAIGAFVLLSAAMLVNTSLRKDVRLTSVDIIIFSFSAYCIAISLIYIDKVNWREVAKLLIPLLTYIIAKNILKSAAAYHKLIGVMICGFVIPIGLSVGLIAVESKNAVDLVDFWSGIPRWQGAYNGAHSLAHNATFLLMLVAVYFVLPNSSTEGASRSIRTKKILVLPLVIGVLYCLYQSQVRTTALGLIVFLILLLYRENKKALITILVLASIVTAATLPTLTPRFFYDLAKVESGEWAPTELGSGRPLIWQNNFNRYFEMTPDRIIVGAGIGNKNEYGGSEGFSDSHNDFLDVFIQTGFIGFGLFIALHIVLLKRILILPEKTRDLFLAVFMAVVVMNIMSSSYVNRFGLAQMYYILLSFVEIRREPTEKTEE
jgi:O-antigen ligase